MPCSSMISVVSETRVFPKTKTRMEDLKLSVSDLPMLSCHYIQKGCLFNNNNNNNNINTSTRDAPNLIEALSRTLSIFPPLAGRLSTDSEGRVYLSCNDQGALFLEASAPGIQVKQLIEPVRVASHVFRPLFPFDSALSFSGHSRPLLAVQVTYLADGVFVGCAVNHAVVDGTSFWNFFNTFAECCRSSSSESILLSHVPEFDRRECVLVSDSAVLKLPPGGPSLTFAADSPIVERIFRFSAAAVASLKRRANYNCIHFDDAQDEIMGKQIHDKKTTTEISSFQSLSALLWQAVTRARGLGSSKKQTTLRMAVNCRHRLTPKLDAFYFGNAIQSVATVANACEVVSNEIVWCANKLNANIRAHDNKAVRGMVSVWENSPRCFPLGNPDGASLTIGSSPRFPMYDNNFGWGPPVAVHSGPANKFDGKVSAFPGPNGDGTVDLEVVLSPLTMSALESDSDFMSYVS